MKKMNKWKVFGLCAAMTGTISLVGAGVVAATDTVQNVPAVKTVLGSTNAVPEEELSIKEIVANSMPAMVSITSTTVEEVRNYLGGGSDLFDEFFGDFFGYGFGRGFGNGYGYGDGYGNGQPQQRKQVSAGTGIIVGETDDDLLIASNHHVVDDATELTVSFIDESVATAEIIGTDQSNDVALIKVPKKDISADTLSKICVIPIGKSADAAIGEQIVVIGNALGYGQSASTGIISAFNRTIHTLNEETFQVEEMSGLIQTDAAVNPGNSGGAMLNMKGELIGINCAMANAAYAESIGYAIPIDTAEPILSDIANGRHVEESENGSNPEQSSIEHGDGNALLGVTVVTVTEEASQEYNMPIGAYVRSVEPGSVAEAAGIREGDIITALDGVKVNNNMDLVNLVSQHYEGDTVELTVECYSQDFDGSGSYVTRTVKATFGKAAADEAA